MDHNCSSFSFLQRRVWLLLFLSPSLAHELALNGDRVRGGVVQEARNLERVMCPGDAVQLGIPTRLAGKTEGSRRPEERAAEDQNTSSF